MQQTDDRVREALSGFGLEARPGEVARAIRLARGLSLAEVAERVGSDTHFTTIGKIETGKRKFTAEWGYALAQALGVPTFAFYDPTGEFIAATKVPVYTSMTQVDQHPDTAANSFIFFAGTRESVFALTLLGFPDLAGEVNVQTILVDPNSKKLRAGALYLFSVRGDNEPLVGIYRDDLETPRVISWPNLTTSLEILSDGHDVVGQVFEIRRQIDHPHR